MMRGYRNNLLWMAAMVHRVSGVALALFLPAHLIVLGLALEGASGLDGFLQWTDSPIVKLAEAGLVFLFAVHLLGGLRLLWLENFPWRDSHRALATVAGIASIALALGFYLNLDT